MKSALSWTSDGAATAIVVSCSLHPLYAGASVCTPCTRVYVYTPCALGRLYAPLARGGVCYAPCTRGCLYTSLARGVCMHPLHVGVAASAIPGNGRHPAVICRLQNYKIVNSVRLLQVQRSATLMLLQTDCKHVTEQHCRPEESEEIEDNA